MRTRERLRVGLACALVAAFSFALWRTAAPPSGAVEVPWDRVACARCRMLVSDPRFAGQLHKASGEVHFFDDPGCLLLELSEHEDAAATPYFRDSRSERWLGEAQVVFQRVPETPMGYGFMAVARETLADGLSPDAARALLQAGADARPGTP
jgi:hypothetical protein